MKKISVWAKHHVLAARIIISVMHLLLVLIAYYISQHIQFNFSFFTLYFIGLVIIAAQFIYPYARKKSYVLQKTILFITSSCFFLIVCFAMKHNFMLSSNQNAYSSISLPFDSLSKKINSNNSFSSVTYKDYRLMNKSEKRAFRKEIKQQIKVLKKEMRQPNVPRPTAEDAALIFLIVICGIGLLYGLAILVCSISCGGIPAIAIIFTLLGMGGIGVALYFIIRKLHNNVEHESNQMRKTKEAYKHKTLLPSLI